jgi:hypothetical protein
MTAETTVQATIDNARNLATDMSNLAAGYASDAILYALSILSLNDYSLTEPTTNSPAADYRPEDFSADYESVYESQILSLPGVNRAEFQNFLDAYFPDYTNFTNSIVTWLEDVITNSETGLETTWENAVWERERENEIKELNRGKEAALTDFAKRGWTMPGGQLVGVMEAMEEKAIDQNSTHAREVAIKHLDMAFQQAQNAAQLMAQLQDATTKSALQYIREYNNAISVGLNKADGWLKAKQLYLQMANEWYRTQYAWSDIKLKYQGLLSDKNQKLWQFSSANWANSVDARVKAAIGAAGAVAEVGKGAISSQNTFASIVSQTTQSI